jgi:hypothetical protein
MTEPVAPVDLFGQFQTEHLIFRALFDDPDIGPALQEAGYSANDISNRRALFSNLEIVALLEGLPDNDPLKVTLREARWGTVVHRGGSSTELDGYQAQKNAFQRELVRDWFNRSQPGYNGPDTPITKEAFRYGIDYLSKFSDDLAAGLIKDGNGKPLGVMRADVTSTQYTEAFYRYANNFDPSIMNNPDAPEVQGIRQFLDGYHDNRVTVDVSDTEARFLDIERLASAAKRVGSITVEMFNDVLGKLGYDLPNPNTDRTRNAGALLYHYLFSKSSAYVGNLPGLGNVALSQFQALVEAAHNISRTAVLADAAERLKVINELSKSLAGRLPASLRDFGTKTAGLIHRSAAVVGSRATVVANDINASSLNGFKAAFAGLGIGYIDYTYEAWRKVFSGEGGVGDLVEQTAIFGGVSVAAIGLISGVTALAAGTAAAPFVAALVVGAGTVGTGIALGNLVAKIIKDLPDLELVPRQDGAINNDAQADYLYQNNVGERILYNWVRDQGSIPVLETADNLRYLVDDLDPRHPDAVDGTDVGELFYGNNGAVINGGGGTDEIYHYGYGDAYGGAGQDIVVGFSQRSLKKGDVLKPWLNELADERDAYNKSVDTENQARSAAGRPLLDRLPTLSRSPLADADKSLLLDGGEGNDIVFAIGNNLLSYSGADVTTAGGLGRDWIYNTSKEGILWGDVANSFVVNGGQKLGYFRKADGSVIKDAVATEEFRGYVVDVQIEIENEQGETETQTVKAIAEIKDDASNADVFWFASGTTIMDAQEHDRLKLFGITLTGGDTTLTSAALALSVFAGPIAGAGVAGAAAAVNLGRAAVGAPLIYFDRFVPFITYRLVEGAAAGTQDLLVGNVLDDFLGLLDNPTAPQSRGTMRVVDFDRGAGRVFSAPGDLGISLDDFNPLALLAANDNDRSASDAREVA